MAARVGTARHHGHRFAQPRPRVPCNPLATIAAAYEDDECWMTYGTWVSSVDPVQRGWGPYPPETDDFRTASWHGTAVRTWKRWLWDLIDDHDLRDSLASILLDRGYSVSTANDGQQALDERHQVVGRADGSLAGARVSALSLLLSPILP